MYFSGTELVLCFCYKLLTSSMGNMVILDFYSKRAGDSIQSAGPVLGWPFPFPRGKQESCIQPWSLIHHHHHLSSGGRGCLLSAQPADLPANFVGCHEKRKTPIPAAPQVLYTPGRGRSHQTLLPSEERSGTQHALVSTWPPLCTVGKSEP